MSKMIINPPVKTTTKGGYVATIFELEPDDLGDGINGSIETKGEKQVPACWNDVGYCRDSDLSANLDPHAPEVAAIIKQLQRLRAA